jgi:Asp/Glu/hydantoin racemase
MRIWHQSFTVIEHLPAYTERMRAHIAKVTRPDTEVVLHGVVPGTYPSEYPGDDLAYTALFAMHAPQWIARALEAEKAAFDAYAMCTLPNPMLREVRTLVDIPVVGYGEACFHMASMLGHRFGMMIFIERMVPLYREQLTQYGLASRCAAIRGAGFTFHDVVAGFTNPGPMIDRFRESARKLIAEGADVIIPGEMPLNLLLATEGVSQVDGVPILDGLAVTLSLSECLVDLKQRTGLMASRNGWYGQAPKRERVAEVMKFYGLDRLGGGA